MKKIQKKKDLEKIQKRNQLIIGVVMIFLLTASTLGFALMSQDSSNGASVIQEYMGQEFVEYNGMWNLKGTNYFFYNLPVNTFETVIEGNYSIYDFNGKPLYFVNISSEAELILSNLNGAYSRYQEACIEDCDQDLPIKNCSVDNVIIFDSGEENKVSRDENCIYISGDYAKGVDALNYKLIGMR